MAAVNSDGRGRFFTGRRPCIIGHRGAAGVAPENTLVSFRQAIQDGADILELDVYLTSDKQVVVIHDAAVDRTTDGVGKISDFTLEQLRSLDAGYRFQAGGSYPFRGKGIKIPTLQEVLDAFPGTPFSIEIKENNRALVRELIKVLERNGRLSDGSVICASFKHRALAYARRLAPQLATNFSKPETVAMMARVKLCPALWRRKRSFRYVFQIQRKVGRFNFTNQKAVRAVQALGYEVQVWTVNDEREMRHYLAMGVDGIITDFPGRLRKVMDEQNQ